MTKHKYDYTITDIDALQAAYPVTVEVTKHPVRSFITKLLDRDVVLPGLELNSAPHAPSAQQLAPSASDANPKGLFGKPVPENKKEEATSA